MSFHIDYFGKNKGEDKKPKKGETPPPEAVIKEIIEKHDAATNNRRFNAILATASINNAIEYYDKFKAIQAQMKQADENYEPLNIACVFSRQPKATKMCNRFKKIYPQEKLDNTVAPDERKKHSPELLPITTSNIALTTPLMSLTCTIKMCKNALKTKSIQIRIIHAKTKLIL